MLVRGIDDAGHEVVLDVPRSEVGKVLLQLTGEWAALSDSQGKRWEARDREKLELRPFDPRAEH